MADRRRHRRRVGGVHHQPDGHDHQAPRAPHVRGHLVLHRHRADGGDAAHRELAGLPRLVPQELLDLRRRAGCTGSVVVRPQRRRLLPHHALPRADVLLPAQGRQPPRVFLPPLHHPFLGPDLPLHLGRPAPPALQRPARLGPIPRHGILHHADRALLGRHAQRVAHAARRVGQGPPGSRAEVPGRGRHRLRHGHPRRPPALHQERQRPLPFHGLDHRARPHRRPRLERIPDLRRAVLVDPPALQHEAVLHQARQLPLLDRPDGHAVLRGPNLLGRRSAGPDAQAVHARRLPPISELPRDHARGAADVAPAGHRRLTLSRRHASDGRQPAEDREARRLRARHRGAGPGTRTRPRSRTDPRRGSPLPPPRPGAQACHLHRAHARSRRHRRTDRDGPHLRDPLERPHHRRRQTLHPPGAPRARPLHPRGLRRLSLAAGAPIPLGNRALRTLFKSRRVRVRPSVPLGLQAHRARPVARRPQVPRRLALQPHGGSAPRVAGVHHAALPLAQPPAAQRHLHRPQDRRPPPTRGALPRRL